MRYTYPSLFHPGKLVEIWVCDGCCDGRELHREDGPAVIFPDGTEQWWRHGTKLTDAEIFQLQLTEIRKQILAGTDRPIVVRKPSYSWGRPDVEIPTPELPALTPPLKKGSGKTGP